MDPMDNVLFNRNHFECLVGLMDIQTSVQNYRNVKSAFKMCFVKVVPQVL